MKCKCGKEARCLLEGIYYCNPCVWDVEGLKDKVKKIKYKTKGWK